NSCQFHGLSGDDANKHLDKVLHVTQSIKVNGVTDDALRLYLFPHSLTHHATTWFNRLPRNSINTFEQMAKMFLGKYFPPSMVTKLQIDTFYNGLTLRHRDTINAAAVERETEVTKDTMPPTNNGSTKDVQPPVVQTETPIQNSEPVVAPVAEPIVAPKLPKKLGDPGKFLIPCDFPEMAECLALADLDASINLMPLSVWNKLSLPDLSPTCMTLELTDRSISRSVGVSKDVFIKVGTFHFPADFVVVDFDADPRVPLIHERSFLKTRRALIDVFESKLTLRVGKEAITFNLDQTSRYSANYNDMTANQIDVIDMASWERYKLSIDRCPNHNMLPVTQIDTFYNELTLRHRDTINAAAGGTFMKRHPEECYDLIENMTPNHNDWDISIQRSESSSSITSSSDPEIVALKSEMAKINRNLMIVLQINQ
nr:reverse transcriptase domain-containing protein [Tanacetum cinerariifolium]